MPYRLAMALILKPAGEGWVLRVELRTSRTTIWRDNQLRYTHHITAVETVYFKLSLLKIHDYLKQSFYSAS